MCSSDLISHGSRRTGGRGSVQLEIVGQQQGQVGGGVGDEPLALVEDGPFQHVAGQPAARVRAALTGLPVKMLGLLCGLLPMFALCLTGLLLLPRGLALSAFLTAYYLAEDLLVNQLHYIDLLLDLGSTRPARRRLQALLARPNAPDPAPAPDGRVQIGRAHV